MADAPLKNEREIEVGRARAGMLLKQAASDLMGNALFPAGRRLSENDLRTLKAWGVRTVVVELPDTASGPPAPDGKKEGTARRYRRSTTRILRAAAKRPAPPPPPSPSPGQAPDPDAKRKCLAAMFADHAGHPLMEKIRAIAEEQLARRDEGNAGKD